MCVSGGLGLFLAANQMENKIKRNSLCGTGWRGAQSEMSSSTLVRAHTNRDTLLFSPLAWIWSPSLSFLAGVSFHLSNAFPDTPKLKIKMRM